MTNNDELAMKLKAAAEKALPAIEKYEAGEIDGDDALEMLSDFTDVIKPANILALLAERDADKKRIAEMEARQLDVIVPPRRCFDYVALAVQERDEQWHKALHDACKRGGIKLEVGEQS